MRAYRVQISRLPQKAKRRDDHATVFLTFCHLISIFVNVGDLLQYSPFKPNSPFPIPFAQSLVNFRQISTLAKFSIFAIFLEITKRPLLPSNLNSRQAVSKLCKIRHFPVKIATSQGAPLVI